MASTVSRQLESFADWHLVFVRLALGLPIFFHGIGKLGYGPFAGSVAGFADLLAMNGLPAAMVFAWVVTVVEVVGGALILAGLFTRYAAALVAVDMAVATLLIHWPQGYPVSDGGYELTLTLFFLAIALVLAGGGERQSLEYALFDEEY